MRYLRHVYVEAVQCAEVIALVRSCWATLPDWVRAGYERGKFTVQKETLSLYVGDNMVLAHPADWLILDGKKLSISKPEAFVLTYQPVDDTSPAPEDNSSHVIVTPFEIAPQ